MELFKSLLGLLMLALCIFFVITFSKQCSKGVTESIDSIKVNVGNKVVIGSDTLMILDYNILNGSYILDDGRTISSDLYDKVKL